MINIKDLPPEVRARIEPAKRSKYGNRRVMSDDGLLFDSAVEERRYQFLRLRLLAGEISRLQVHPKFTLLPSFKTASGKRHRAIVFTPDFSYTEDGRQIYEDVKGSKETTDFVMRRKLLQHQKPDMFFRVVRERRKQWDVVEY